MARIRTVKPEFFKHYDLFKAEKETRLPIRLAFQGLWLCADKEGRFKYNPTHLKLDVLPYDEVDFKVILAALEAYGFILKYSADGKKYGWIPTLKDHQRFNGTEAKAESRLPAPPENLKSGISLEDLRNQYGSNMALPWNDDSELSDFLCDEPKTPADPTNGASLELPRNTGRERKGKERNKEGEGIRSHTQGTSLELPNDNLGAVTYDIEKYVLENQRDYEILCMEASKLEIDEISFKQILHKFHLWHVSKETYPKKPLPLIAGLKTWLLNQKNFSGNGTHQQHPAKSNPRTAGVNKLLKNLKNNIAAGGRGDNPG